MSGERTTALHQVIKGGGFIFTGHIASFIVAFLFQFIVARYLGPEGYGVISLGVVIMSLGVILVNVGLPSGVQRFISLYLSKNDDTRVKGTLFASFSIIIFMSLIIVPLGLIFSDFLAETFFHSVELSSIVKTFVIAIPFAAFTNIFYQICIGFRKPVSAILIDVVFHKTVRLVITVIALAIGSTVLQIGVIYLSGLVVAALAGFIILYRMFPLLISKTGAEKNYRELLTFSLPLFFASSLVIMMGRIDSLMIGYFAGASEVGIYKVGESLSAFLGLFKMSFSSFFLSVITVFFAKKNFEMIGTIYRSVSHLIFMLTFPCALFFVLFSRHIVSLIYGTEYGTGGLVLLILSVGHMGTLFFGPGAAMIEAAGRTKWLLRIGVLALILNVVLNIVLIPIWGMYGAALSTAFTIMLVAVLRYVKVKELTHLFIDKIAYLKYFVAALIPGTLVYVLLSSIMMTRIIILVGGFVVFFLIYLVLLVVLRALDEDDLVIVRAVEEKLGMKNDPISRFVKLNG